MNNFNDMEELAAILEKEQNFLQEIHPGLCERSEQCPDAPEGLRAKDKT